MGESIARLLATKNPCPMEFVATQDTFGESGTPAQLMEKYGLNKNAIVQMVHAVRKRI
jgi:transketolase